MGSLQEMERMLRDKDEKIKELQRLLEERDESIRQLRSKLDKFQSVLPQAQSNIIGGPRKQRAQGISAEPQALSSIHDFSKVTARRHSKSNSGLFELQNHDSPALYFKIEDPFLYGPLDTAGVHYSIKTSLCQKTCKAVKSKYYQYWCNMLGFSHDFKNEPYIKYAPSFDVAHLKASSVKPFSKLPTKGEI